MDYDEVFAPVARSQTLRILLSVAGKRNYVVNHFDIKTAFLNRELKEEIYMKQPPGFEVGNKLIYVPTNVNIADLMPLAPTKTTALRKRAGLEKANESRIEEEC